MLLQGRGRERGGATKLIHPESWPDKGDDVSRHAPAGRFQMAKAVKTDTSLGIDALSPLSLISRIDCNCNGSCIELKDNYK